MFRAFRRRAADRSGRCAGDRAPARTVDRRGEAGREGASAGARRGGPRDGRRRHRRLPTHRRVPRRDDVLGRVDPSRGGGRPGPRARPGPHRRIEGAPRPDRLGAAHRRHCPTPEPAAVHPGVRGARPRDRPPGDPVHGEHEDGARAAAGRRRRRRVHRRSDDLAPGFVARRTFPRRPGLARDGDRSGERRDARRADRQRRRDRRIARDTPLRPHRKRRRDRPGCRGDRSVGRPDRRCAPRKI